MKHLITKENRLLLRGVNDGAGHIFRFKKPVTVPKDTAITVGVTRPDWPTNGSAVVTVRPKDKPDLVLYEKQTIGEWEDDPRFEASTEEE